MVGWALGMAVVGVIVGIPLGIAVGTELINTDSASILSHSSAYVSVKLVREPLISVASVESIINST